MPFSGPVLGPICGGFIAETVGWRWSMWVIMIFAFVCLVAGLPLPESCMQVLVQREAAKAAKDGKNIIVPEKAKFFKLLKTAIVRPFKMALVEYMIDLVSLYISFCFGVLYTFFFAYPFVFTGIHGFSVGISGLMFAGLGIGVLLGSAVQAYFFVLDRKSIMKNNGVLIPERTLYRACIGAPMIPIALFWFA
jgi:MFS family permease